MLKYLFDIDKLQRELNIVIGRDTVGDKDKLKWSTDYHIALMSEAHELMNCTSWKWWSIEGKEDLHKKIINLKNAKIEAIDILHFLVSLIQIHDVQVEDYEINLESKDLISYCIELIDLCVFGMKLNSEADAETLVTEVNFDEIFETKTILTSDIFNIDNSLTNQTISDDTKKNFHSWNIRNMLYSLECIFKILEISDEDILAIYKLKHEKNLLRQKNNYSVLNKTEEDNKEIESKI
jgi:hypothetical protein